MANHPPKVLGILGGLGPMATVEVLGFVSAISIYIAVKMVQGAKAELAAKKMRAANS